jgi:cyclophilin family peptidyl-prolyl cis-trans isomerase
MTSTVPAPGAPLVVRFLLHNTSSDPITVPGTSPTPAGIGLPAETILGTAAEPAVSLVYQGTSENFTDNMPVPLAEGVFDADDATTVHETLLSPQCSLGRALDLRDVFAELRYSGRYELIWRPLGGRYGERRLSFRLESRKEAVIVTDYGKVTFELFYEDAPLNVANFLELVRREFYDGLPIHAIVPGQVIQAGCPVGDGSGMRPDGETVPAEFDSPHVFKIGTLGMSRKPGDPDSASCQFFITLTRLPELDGKYTIIGEARDEQSLRTLLELSAVSVNENYVPREPVVIRSIVLVDVDRDITRVRELGASRRAADETAPAPASR